MNTRYNGIIPVRVLNADQHDINYTWHITVKEVDGTEHKIGASTDEKTAETFAANYIKMRGLNAAIILEPKPVI